MFFDCHTHIDQYALQEMPGILERARQAGVTTIVTAGVTLDTSRACVELAGRFPEIYAGVGLHPADLTGPVTGETVAALRALALSSPKVVCISEIGLDFMPQSPDHDLQYDAFRRQIRLARELRLPIIFHSREAHTETLRVLQEEGGEEVGGAMHYFQADVATAWEAIASGFFISLARPLLRLPHLQDVAREVPLEHIVLETDSFPQPFKKHRENWTEPRHVRQVAEALAEIKGVSLQKVAEVTTLNARRLLRWERLPSQTGRQGWS